MPLIFPPRQRYPRLPVDSPAFELPEKFGVQWLDENCDPVNTLILPSPPPPPVTIVVDRPVSSTLTQKIIGSWFYFDLLGERGSDPRVDDEAEFDTLALESGGIMPMDALFSEYPIFTMAPSLPDYLDGQPWGVRGTAVDTMIRDHVRGMSVFSHASTNSLWYNSAEKDVLEVSDIQIVTGDGHRSQSAVNQPSVGTLFFSNFFNLSGTIGSGDYCLIYQDHPVSPVYHLLRRIFGVATTKRIVCRMFVYVQGFTTALSAMPLTAPGVDGRWHTFDKDLETEYRVLFAFQSPDVSLIVRHFTEVPRFILSQRA